MDNLEFLQWMKRYYEINCSGEGYDPVGRRKGQDLYYILGGGKVGAAGGSKGVVKPKPAAAASSKIGGAGAGAGVKAKPTTTGAATKAGGSSAVSADVK